MVLSLARKVADSSSAYRFERKFFVEDLERPELEQCVRFHPALFSDLYEPRHINNIYFDTADMSCYRANVDGVMNRIKARIRWYGDLFGDVRKAKLELKIKRGLVGRKVSFPVAPFRFDREQREFELPDLIGDDDLAEFTRLELRRMSPALVNRYTRRYYLSNDKHFRITIDWDMSFYPPPRGSGFIVQRRSYRSLVLELKYAHEHDGDAHDITRHLPFRMTRSSKYVTGVESLSLF